MAFRDAPDRSYEAAAHRETLPQIEHAVETSIIALSCTEESEKNVLLQNAFIALLRVRYEQGWKAQACRQNGVIACRKKKKVIG
jgi:hypothetical protein